MKKPTKKSILNKKSIFFHIIFQLTRTDRHRQLSLIKNYAKDMGLDFNEKKVIGDDGKTEYRFSLHNIISFKKFMDNDDLIRQFAVDISNFHMHDDELKSSIWEKIHSMILHDFDGREFLTGIKEMKSSGWITQKGSLKTKKFTKPDNYYIMVRNEDDFFRTAVEADDLMLFRKYFPNGIKNTVFHDVDPQKLYDNAVKTFESMFSSKKQVEYVKSRLSLIKETKPKYIDQYGYKKPRFRIFFDF